MSECAKKRDSEAEEPPVNICPKCRADLFEVGVVEVIVGGYAETYITFTNGKKETGTTEIQNFDEQWALCGKCNERIEHTAVDVIDAFEELQLKEGNVKEE